MSAKFFQAHLAIPPRRTPELPIPAHVRATERHNTQFVLSPLFTSLKSLNQRKFSLTLAACAQRRRRPSLQLVHNTSVTPASLSSHSPSFQLPR
jgi:hypothetical protein